MHSSGITTANQLGELGFSDMREIQALSASLATFDAKDPAVRFENVRSEILKGIADPNYVATENEAAMNAMPALRSNAAVRVARAKAEGADLMNPLITQKSDYNTAADWARIDAARSAGLGNFAPSSVEGLEGIYSRSKLGVAGLLSSKLRSDFNSIENQRLLMMYQSGADLSTSQEVELYKSLGGKPGGIQYPQYGGQPFVPEKTLKDLIDALDRNTQSRNTNNSIQAE